MKKQETKTTTYVSLVERHIIKQSDIRFAEMDALCFKSKNLYNRTLYVLRQEFFATGGVSSFEDLVPEFQAENDSDFRALPSKVSAWCVKQACFAMDSFFALISKKLHPRLPRYLHKTDGRMPVFYPKDAISKRSLKQGIIKVSGADFTLNTKVAPEAVQFVRLVHRGNHIVAEVGYRVEPKDPCKNKRDQP